MLSRSRRGFAAGAVLVLAFGCSGGEDSETAAPDATTEREVRPGPQGGIGKPGEEFIRYRTKTDEGEEILAQIGGDVEMPGDFPADVPLYPGAVPTATLAAGSESMIVTFSSSDEQQGVFDFYRTKLAEQGWSVENQASFREQRVLGARKADRKATIGIATVDGATQISIALHKVRAGG